MKKRIAFGLVAVLIGSGADAAEPLVVWRSPATGTIPTPVTSEPPTPPIEVPKTISIDYELNGGSFGVGRTMTLSPTISGGSGKYEFAFAAGTAFPRGILFTTSTGIFFGTPQERGDFSFSLLVRDTQTGAYATAAVRFLVV